MASNLPDISGTPRRCNRSDETGTTVTSARTVLTAATSMGEPSRSAPRCVFVQPTEEETSFYYASFPSRPRLLGRTSSANMPWFFLTNPLRDTYYPFGRSVEFEAATASGPLGPHAIHASWETTTRQKVIGAIAPLDWTSIDILRMGQTTLAEHEQPVIVWVGVAARAVDRPLWDLVALVLGQVRRALDRDGLTDVECEVRVSDTSPAAGSRLLPPARGIERALQGHMEKRAHQAVAASVGQSISPRNAPWVEGLGLYLAPETTADAQYNQEEPVWALTCRHVVFPDNDSDNADGKDRPAHVLLPAATTLDQALRINKLAIEEAKSQLHVRRGSGLSLSEAQAAVLRCMQYHDKLEALSSSSNARVVGEVRFSPPTTATSGPRYTRHWALVALGRTRFLPGFSFESVVDLYTGDVQQDSPYQAIDQCLGSSSQFTRPQDDLMHLQDVIPLREMLGGPIPHPLVTTVGDETCPIVLKLSHKTGVAAGVALDIRSIVRTCFDGETKESSTWAIQHANAKSTRPSHSTKMSVFSDRSDS